MYMEGLCLAASIRCNVSLPVFSSAIGPSFGLFHRCRSAAAESVPSECRRLLRSSTMAFSQKKTAEPSASIESSASDSGYLWDVQEILAERTSGTSGHRELLVVWKPSWIPKCNMIRDGPVMRRFTEERKWKFVSAAGDLLLPVQPGSVLQQDCLAACSEAVVKNMASDLAAEQTRFMAVGTPRKSLGGVAKKPSKTASQKR